MARESPLTTVQTAMMTTIWLQMPAKPSARNDLMPE